MAKRHRAVATPAPAADATATYHAPEAGPRESFVTFRVGSEAFGVRLRDVSEIIRPPALSHMPLAPRSLLGLANLRGTVLPVVSLARVLRFDDTPHDRTARVIVVNRGAPVGLFVEEVNDLLAVPATRLETADQGAGGIDPTLLDGVIKGQEGETTTKILDPAQLLRGEFARLDKPAPRTVGDTAAVHAPAPQGRSDTRITLVSFDLADQEYALPLDRIHEIIALPPQVTMVARAETAVLGVVTLRDRLLPLVSLHALLGLPDDASKHDGRKVVVLALGGARVGLLADRTREILRVPPESIDPAPALLTRGEGDAEITSICRLENGRRLVAVLSPERLFRSDVVRRVLADQASDLSTNETDHDAMAEEQFVVFRLGEQDYGLPIRSVEEIARRPEQITRLPRAPKFIDGVMNLRGTVVPIVDLRRRFDLPAAEQAGAQRILVLAVGGARAGFLVDAVSEIRKVDSAAISVAPDLSAEQMRLIGRVANLGQQDRMILLVDPQQLLDKAETGELARLDTSPLARAVKTS